MKNARMSSDHDQFGETNEHPLRAFKFCPRCGGEFVRNNMKSNRCSRCDFVYYFNPSAAVACFVRDGGDRILVAVRGVEPSKGGLDLPGGFVDSYETAEQAARREVEQETGLVVRDVSYLLSRPNIYRYSGFDVHTLDVCFECTVDSFDGVMASDDVAQLRVVSIDALDPDEFAFRSISQAVREYKQRWIGECERVGVGDEF